jgi:hypothetical protein
MSGGIMSRRTSARLGRALLLLALATLVGSCSPYLGLNVGVPFNVGNVTINPNIGVGFPL